MRIITGKAKGLKLAAPEKGTRPLTDRIKTSIFDLISEFIPNASVLDLYAGSGNFGLEAISRGANEATFIDYGARAIEIIHQNIEKAKFEEQSIVVKDKVNNFITSTDELYDIIFLDPPFDSTNEEDFSALGRILSEDGLLILRIPNFKEKNNFDFRPLNEVYRKTYGRSIVIFFKK